MLAEIDPSDTRYKLQELELQLEQVQADWDKMAEGPKPEEVKLLEEGVHQAEIKSELAAREWNKTRNGYDAGTTLRAELQQKEDEMKLAQSNLKAAQYHLALLQKGPSPSDTAKFNAKVKEIELQRDKLQKDLSNMQIVSERSGTVTNVSVKEGQLVETGREMLTVSDVAQLEIVSDVKESLASQVFVNQEAVIKGNALGKDQVAAHVVKLAPVAGASQVNLDKTPVVAVTLALDKGLPSCCPATM